MAAARKTTAPTIESIIEEEDVDQVTPPEEPVVEETAAQRRLRELQAELEAEEARDLTNPADAAGRPLPVTQLTEEQKQIRDLEDRLARRKAANITSAFEEASSGDTIHIHFVKDGFTASGQVWYRGQEVVFDKAGEAYALTKDKNGNSWLDLAGDTGAQYLRFGDEYFRPGPFHGRPGEVFQDAIALEDARRGVAAPVTRL